MKAMEEYRYKYYWTDGNVSFRKVRMDLMYVILEQAYLTAHGNKLLDKMELYKGSRLIATFYK